MTDEEIEGFARQIRQGATLTPSDHAKDQPAVSVTALRELVRGWLVSAIKWRSRGGYEFANTFGLCAKRLEALLPAEGAEEQSAAGADNVSLRPVSYPNPPDVPPGWEVMPARPDSVFCLPHGTRGYAEHRDGRRAYGAVWPHFSPPLFAVDGAAAWEVTELAALWIVRPKGTAGRHECEGAPVLSFPRTWQVFQVPLNAAEPKKVVAERHCKMEEIQAEVAALTRVRDARGAIDYLYTFGVKPEWQGEERQRRIKARGDEPLHVGNPVWLPDVKQREHQQEQQIGSAAEATWGGIPISGATDWYLVPQDTEPPLFDGKEPHMVEAGAWRVAFAEPLKGPERFWLERRLEKAETQEQVDAALRQLRPEAGK